MSIDKGSLPPLPKYRSPRRHHTTANRHLIWSESDGPATLTADHHDNSSVLTSTDTSLPGANFVEMMGIASRSEKWYKINDGIDNLAYQDPEKGAEQLQDISGTPYPILRLSSDGDPSRDNLTNLNISLKCGTTQNDLGRCRTQIPRTTLTKNRLRRFWKLKFHHNKDKKKRNVKFVTTVAVLTVALFLFLATLAVVLFLTVGGGLEAKMEKSSDQQSPSSSRTVTTDILANRVVLGIFKIKNLNYDQRLENKSSSEFFMLSKDIKLALDRLYKFSQLQKDYNGTEILSFRKGSIVVDFRVYLKKPYMNVAETVGMSFIRGLVNAGGGMLLDSRFDIDVQSIMFTATKGPSQRRSGKDSKFPEPGWSEWTPWSSCNNVWDFSNQPRCDPTMRQTRVRVCREDRGHGKLMRDDEICEEQGGSPMQEKACNCMTTTTTMPTTTNTSLSQRRKCSECYEGEICISFLDEDYMATCHVPKDPNDPTGCGGLCMGSNQLCRSLGAGAVKCVRDHRKCNDAEWRCDDGMCIPKSRVCDDQDNCFDRSDEANCKCSEKEYQCPNTTKCIHHTSLCDGKFDCWDGSDEHCPNRKLPGCGPGRFMCQSGMCIIDKYFCDFYADCDDSSDEPEGCQISCSGERTQCRNQRCIPSTLWCDGHDDCGDDSDEINCAIEARLSNDTVDDDDNATTNSVDRFNATNVETTDNPPIKL